METPLSPTAIVQLLKDRQGTKSLREFAEEIGVTAVYIGDLYAGRRNPGPKIFKGLGLPLPSKGEKLDGKNRPKRIAPRKAEPDCGAKSGTY